MLRWCVWGLTVFAFAAASTLSSRARNSRSYRYHGLTALFSHGVWIVQQLIGIDIIVDALHSSSHADLWTAGIVYTATALSGSLFAQWLALEKLERKP